METKTSTTNNTAVSHANQKHEDHQTKNNGDRPRRGTGDGSRPYRGRGDGERPYRGRNENRANYDLADVVNTDDAYKAKPRTNADGTQRGNYRGRGDGQYRGRGDGQQRGRGEGTRRGRGNRGGNHRWEEPRQLNEDVEVIELNEDQIKFIDEMKAYQRKNIRVLQDDQVLNACLEFSFDHTKVIAFLKTYETEDKYKGMEEYEWQNTESRKDKEEKRQREAARRERERLRKEEQKVRAERRAEAERRKEEAEKKRMEREERQKERQTKKEAFAAENQTEKVVDSVVQAVVVDVPVTTTEPVEAQPTPKPAEERPKKEKKEKKPREDKQTKLAYKPKQVDAVPQTVKEVKHQEPVVVDKTEEPEVKETPHNEKNNKNSKENKKEAEKLEVQQIPQFQPNVAAYPTMPMMPMMQPAGEMTLEQQNAYNQQIIMMQQQQLSYMMQVYMWQQQQAQATGQPAPPMPPMMPMMYGFPGQQSWPQQNGNK